MTGAPTGTVTFLFTDIEGSTKRWEQDPQAMRAALAHHDRILRAAIEANGGFAYKIIGDAFQVAFSSAPAAVAAALAAQAGIHEVRAGLLPEGKVAAVRELQDGGRSVLAVGDGVNDAPLLATAAVGVAMGGYGAGIATDAADVVVTVENVERVADVIDLGRRMVAVARQGIFFGIGASVLLMILASLGYIAPAIGALLQEVLDVVTILNALRAR